MRNLFRPPSEALTADLSLALKAIHATTPLSRPHERELPFAVRDLSTILTQDRAQMARSYWINKRLLTAYCRYFLPWNLVRLSWLLPGLDLSLKEGDLLLDLGSGPLTMPLALWLTKPEWRSTPLTVVCADVAPGPLALGRDIFNTLAPDSPWKIELRRGPLEAALRSFSGKAALVTAANVLNEFKPPRETPLEMALAALAGRIAPALAPNGRFLAVEPGTRLGGKLMATLRHAAFSAHLLPEAPCPHWGSCPMLARETTGWCHFSLSTGAAPEKLAALTARAGLQKYSLSLSCLQLRRATEAEQQAAAALLPEEAPDPFDDEEYDTATDGGDYDDAQADRDALAAWAEAYATLRARAMERPFARIMSEPIRLPDRAEPARYGCSVKGLVLAHGALRIPSGAAIAVRWPEPETRDLKTGAIAIEAVPPPRGDGGSQPQRAAPGTPRQGYGRENRTTPLPARSRDAKQEPGPDRQTGKPAPSSRSRAPRPAPASGNEAPRTPRPPRAPRPGSDRSPRKK